MSLDLCFNSADEDLAKAAGDGSEEAYELLVERYASLVFHLAFKITGNREDSEDIVQETFLKVHKNIRSYDQSKASFKTWLLTVTRNQSLNTFAVLKRRGSRFISTIIGDPEDESAAQRFLNDDPGPEKALIDRQELNHLSALLDELPEKQRTALLLKVWEELSYQEIGTIMNISPSAVESLIYRARKKLVDQFD